MIVVLLNVNSWKNTVSKMKHRLGIIIIKYILCKQKLGKYASLYDLVVSIVRAALIMIYWIDELKPSEVIGFQMQLQKYTYRLLARPLE